MPEITICPECDRTLKVPDDLLGKKVRCPGCSLSFIAQIGVGLLELVDELDAAPGRPTHRRSEGVRKQRSERANDRDDEDDDRPARRRRDDDDEDDRPRRRKDLAEDDSPRRGGVSAATRWGRVRLGITLVIFASWIVFGLSVFPCIGGVLLVVVPVAQVAVSGLMGVLLLAELGLRLIGQAMCIFVPSKRNSAARGLAIAAFCCNAGTVVSCSIAGIMAALGSGMSETGGGALGLATASIGGGIGLFFFPLMLGSFICWMLFLRSLARRFRYEELAQQIIQYMVAVLIFGAVVAVMIILIGALMPRSLQGPGRSSMGAGVVLARIMGFIIWGVWLGMYLWYILRLLIPVRDLIDEHVG